MLCRIVFVWHNTLHLTPCGDVCRIVFVRHNTLHSFSLVTTPLLAVICAVFLPGYSFAAIANPMDKSRLEDP